MAKINWTKTRKFRDYEEKYEPGTELKNGRVVAPRRPDSLAARAAKAEAEWLAERERAAKARRQRRRKAKRGPAKAQRAQEDDLGVPLYEPKTPVIWD